MNDSYFSHIKSKYAPFISFLKEQEGYHFIELGCGAGNITKALREWYKYGHYTLVDNCPKMLSLAIENNPNENCIFLCADITKSINTMPAGDYTIVHSHGVLEHFSDRDIRNIIINACNYAKFQVHYVPSSKYESPSRGDERLLTPREWMDILRTIDRDIDYSVIEFNDGYDLMIQIQGG